MKHNVAQVAALQPDYLGFIFFEKSPRNFDKEVLDIPNHIKRVGVFVDAPISFIIKQTIAFNLDVIQLHGDETVFLINEINKSLYNSRSKIQKPNGIDIWKVISVGDDFDFGKLSEFENVVDKFLFDTKGNAKGGNGFAFDWSVLKNYPSNKPFILSGGISMENISEVKKLIEINLPIYGIDVNSKFEKSPGLKNISALKILIQQFA